MSGEETLQSSKPRRGALRWKYWAAGGLLMFIVFLAAFPKRETLDYIYFAVFCAIAIALASYVCLEMWTLRAKRSSRWTAHFTAFASGGLVIALLVLHDAKLFVWNHLYLEVPFALFCAITAAGAWITEWRKSVLVFVELEGLAFVPAKEPSNNTPHPDAREAPGIASESSARAGGRER